MSFKRSPSKVWWASESLEFPEVSASPGSQDSGFSDTESSPKNLAKKREGNSLKATNEIGISKENTVEGEHVSKDIFKKPASRENLNLSSNYREKSTPVKENIDERLVKSERKNSPHVAKKFSRVSGISTDPVKSQRYIKHSPKVSRSLFTKPNTEECPVSPNQYSNQTFASSNLSDAQETSEQNSCLSGHSRDGDIISSAKSFPLAENVRDTPRDWPKLNQSAPALLETGTEPPTSFGSVSGDCESELERLFEASGGPEHTSTPRGSFIGGSPEKMRHRIGQRRTRQRWRRLGYLDEERVPPVHTDGVTVDNQAVLRWLEEARLATEQECTATLQCKSIAAELNQKVYHLAGCATTILRGLLSHSRCIEMEYRSLNGETKHVSPLVQSLAGNILDFLKTHAGPASSKVLKLHDEIRTSNSERVLEPMARLFNEWEEIQGRVLVKEVKKLVDKLEDPASELDLRATLTGVTSVTLRNANLVEFFVKADIIPILLILCEKCEGSSLRTLILRALSTMCSNSLAVRHFEKFSGVEIVAETLQEWSRPEPERSEAVALLAQVTAPWLEDNHSVKGLQGHSKKLVRSLARFAGQTRCCQNLLLCAASMANLSSMDPKCVRHLIHYDAAPVLLAAVKSRGPMVSVYLLEQVATLLANMAAAEAARRQLTDAEAPRALLHFLRAPRTSPNGEAERRLQQKSVIALSRLCGDKEAARQVVANGGPARLVRLCRERGERHDSDAVLVAALATLRKIAEVCGREVLSTQDAQELVEPKLLDSFLAYSTQNESYV